jgi:hypothetical protein
VVRQATGRERGEADKWGKWLSGDFATAAPGPGKTSAPAERNIDSCYVARTLFGSSRSSRPLAERKTMTDLELLWQLAEVRESGRGRSKLFEMFPDEFDLEQLKHINNDTFFLVINLLLWVRLA